MKTNIRKALLALAVVPGIAFAAPSYEPLFPRGGLDATTQLWANTSTLNGKTLADWGAAIDTNTNASTAAVQNTFDIVEKMLPNYVTIAAINSPTSSQYTGVSGLDTSGNAVSPVQTTGNVWAQSSLRAGVSSGSYPTFSTGWNNGDPFLYPATTLIGGHVAYDDAYLKVIGSPWSMSDSGGAIAAIYDTIGDQGTGRNGCGNDDGCSLYVGTQITPFRVEAGSQVTRDDSTERVVALTGTTVTITPALSSEQLSRIKTWMRIYTNYDAAGGNATGGSYWTNWNGETLTTATFTPNVYYGYISSWNQGTDSTVLNIVSDPNGRASGWRTENSTTTVTTAPGANSGDIIDADSSSPTWAYTSPSVFIGGAYKKFNTNRTVACLPGTNKDTLSRECEGEEMDLWGGSTDTGIGGRTVHGLTISYGGDKPADGSYALDLAGGINNLLVMAPNWYATAVQSDPLYVGPLEGPSRDVSAGNTTSVIASLASSTNTGDQTFSNFTYIRPMWYAERFATDASSTTDFTNETINYGVSVGAGRGQLGTIQEHIAMNPKAYPNGIGLCGYNACAYVDSHGKIVSGGDILTGNGSALYTVDPNGSNAAYAYSDANYQMNVAFNPQVGSSTAYSGAQGAQALHVAGSLVVDQNINTTGNLQVELGKSFGLLDSTGSLLAFQYLVDATTTTGPVAHQVVENKNGLPGTYYVDGAFGTGGAATLASLDVVGAAVFAQGATIPSGKSYAVQSAAGTTYLTADSSGNFTIVQGSPNVGGGIKAATYTLSALPTSVASDGTQVWCSDCTLNGITGVAAYWHASASKWTDSQNGTLAN